MNKLKCGLFILFFLSGTTLGKEVSENSIFILPIVTTDALYSLKNFTINKMYKASLNMNPTFQTSRIHPELHFKFLTFHPVETKKGKSDRILNWPNDANEENTQSYQHSSTQCLQCIPFQFKFPFF